MKPRNDERMALFPGRSKVQGSGGVGVPLVKSAQTLPWRARRALLTAYADHQRCDSDQRISLDYYLMKPGPAGGGICTRSCDLLERWQSSYRPLLKACA